MNMVTALAGFIGWKKAMKRLEKSDLEVFSPQWWDALTDACKFMPEKERKNFIDSFVTVLIDF